jgi:hypothetical protein
MRDRDLVTINWIEIVCASIVFADPVAHELVAIEAIVLPFGGSSTFCHAEDIAIEFFSSFKIVNWDSQVEWINFVFVFFG